MIIGLAFGVGCLFVLLWRWARRPVLMARVAPYVSDLGVRPPDRQPVAMRLLRRGAATLGNALGGPLTVRGRLDRSGWALTPEEFRARQLAAGLASFAAAMVLSALVWTRWHTNSLSLLVFCGACFAAGVVGTDLALTARVNRRDQRLTADFPVVAELLALAVAAGETPVRGMHRVLGVVHGDTADELGRVLADIRTGASAASALDAWSRRTGVAALGRFAEGLAVALERGTPVVDVLHAQAADVREAARRDLIESAGRRDVAMMLPVVFGILPTTVVFAFYPGLVGLRLTM